MKYGLSLAFAMALSGSLYGAFNGSHHDNNKGSSAIYRKDICSTSIFNANTISYDNYTTYELKSGDNYDLLPADMLYAPAFLYSIDEHCHNNQAVRMWFIGSNIYQMSSKERREVVDETMQKDKYGLSLEIDGQRFDKIYKPKITLGTSGQVWQMYEWQKYFDPKIKSKFGIDIFKAVYIKNNQDKLPLELSVSDGIAENKQIPLPKVSAEKADDIILDIHGNEVKIINQTAKRDSVDKFNENIHKIIIPSGYTGVIDTYFEPSSNTKAATYFITQDLEVNKKQIETYIKNPNDSYKDYFRKKNGGNDYFSPVKDTRYDVSTLGLLNPILFENTVYKDEKGAYKGDVYTMHGDFLNRFVTGFGPDGNWEFDNTNEASYRYDSGWMSHRYLEDKGSYNKDGLAYSFGISYDKYDPITTYIDREQMIYASYTNNRRIVYKQYAVDDYDDLKVVPLSDLKTVPLSLHVRPLYAYAKKDGNSYKKSDELMKFYGSGDVEYNLMVRFYPDPQKIVSLKPVQLEISKNELAYNADIKLNNDLSDFSSAEYWNGDKTKPYRSSKGQKFISNGGKEVVCAWVHNIADNKDAQHPILYCDKEWEESKSAYGNVSGYDKFHAIELSYDDIIDGIDIFKLALNDNTSIPIRKISSNYGFNDNAKYQKLELTASLETVYYGNEIRTGGSWDSDFSGTYVYSHKKGDSEYFVGYQYGNNNDTVSTPNLIGHKVYGYRYDVGIKGKKTDSVNKNIGEVAKINFDLTMRINKDETGKNSYVGHIKLTKDGRKALNALTQKSGSRQDIVFLIRIHNIKDSSTGRVIPFSEPFKIKIKGDPEYQLNAVVASDTGNNKAAEDDKGNYTIYTQVGGLFVKENDANNDDFDKNIKGDGGHFVLNKSKDDVSFIKVTLQRKSGESWENMGDVIFKENCIYRGSEYCTHSNHIWTMSNDDGVAAIYSGILPRYNLFNDNHDVNKDKEFLHFTLQSVRHDKNSIRKYGMTHAAYFGNDKIDEFNQKMQSGLFRFKIHKLTKEQVRNALEKGYMKAKGYTRMKYENGGYIYSKSWANTIWDWHKFSDKQTQEFHLSMPAFLELQAPYEYSNTFIVRPAFSRLSKIGDSHISKLDDSHKKIYSYHKALKANDTKNYNLEFDFYSGKVVGDEIEMDKKLDIKLLSSLDKRVDRLAFLFHQYSPKGEDMHYMLNQNLNHSFMQDNTLISPVAFPYVGKDVGVLALVSFKNNDKDTISCRDSDKDDEENKATNGQYGCYPEPILGKANFEPHDKNILCDAKNQFAFFRDREIDETKENELKFNNNGLYNVLYQCVQKYVDEKGSPLYSIDEDQCTDIDDCLFRVKSDRFDYEISGSLTKDNARDNGLHIWLKDINNIDSTKHTYKNLYDLVGDYVVDKNVIADKFYERIYANLAPTLKNGNRIYWLDSVWVFFNEDKPGRMRKDSYYEATINENANAANSFDVGNTFMLSVSKDRKEALPPVYFKELISNDKFDTCEGITTGCIPKNIGKAQGSLKYGILDVEDIVLTKAPSTTTTILDKSNSNDPKFSIKVYDDNGFIDINEDEHFLNAKKSVSYSELKNQIVADTDIEFGNPTTDGYYIDDTSVVDLAYDVGTDIGYKIKTKNPINNSFVDVGSIKVNGTSPVKNILQPSSNTIRIIYQINGGTWRGINNKVK